MHQNLIYLQEVSKQDFYLIHLTKGTKLEIGNLDLSKFNFSQINDYQFKTICLSKNAFDRFINPNKAI